MEGQITYSVQKKTKTHGKNVFPRIKLFQKVQLVNFYSYMTCRLPKAKKLLQGSFIYIWMYKSGGKALGAFWVTIALKK